MRRVVVTGVGMVSPVGNDIKTAWSQTLEGKSGIALIKRFDCETFPVKIAGEVKNFEPGNCMDAKEAGRASRFVMYAAKAAHEAVHNSGFDPSVNADRNGTVIGVGLGSLEDIEQSSYTLKEKGIKRISPFFLPYTIPNMAAGVVSRVHNLRGPNMCTTTACTSGTHAVGEAFLYIRNNMADLMVVGGAEAAISPLGISCFAVMRALSTRNDDPAGASRPFDKDRDGFVMGEGAGVLVIEELEHAKKRGANILAEVVGYGMSGDAYHITSPAPEGEGAQRCMKLCLQSGSIRPEEVDYINAHGTSTQMNDTCESQAIMRVFGDHAQKVSISSTKGVTGHCLGAAGGIEAVFSVLALHHQIVPPTANYTTQDPTCTLDYTPKAKERKLKYAISNSFGFGGTNATIAFRSFS